MTRNESADVVVIGGGVRGLSVAYFLSKAGVDVTVLERRFIAAGASGLNTGYANISGKGPRYYTEFSKMSADMYPQLNEELAEPVEYERNGSLMPIKTEAEWQEYQQTAEERNQVPGVDIRLLAIDEAREIEPGLSRHLVGGAFCPIDGHVNPLKLTRTLARKAAKNGARVYTGQEVVDIRVAAGRIEEVITPKTRISTHVVVNAAGIHVPRIAKMVGLEVPVNPERGQIIISEAMPRIMSRAVGPYIQFENGNVLIGFTNENVGEDKRVTTAMISSRVKKAIRILPSLANGRGIRCTAALRPMPPDRLPIYQKMQGPGDFYVTVGHSGITLAPITGRVFSELITQGRTDIPLDEYRVERFYEQTT